MVFNLPYVGQRFRSLHNILFPSDKGQWRIISLAGGRAIMFSERLDDKPAYVLPDGRLSFMSIKPRAKYTERHGRLIPDNQGRITVTGRYPDFKDNYGRQVWLTAGRDMVFMKCDYVEDHLNAARRRNITFHSNQSSSADVRVLIFARLSGQYDWAVYEGGKKRKSGTANFSANRAERAAMAAFPKAWWQNKNVRVKLDMKKVKQERAERERRYAEQGFRNA